MPRFFQRTFLLRTMAVLLALSAVTLPNTAHAWDRFGGRGYYGHGYGYGYRGYGPGLGLGLALGLGVGAVLAAPPVYYAPPPVVYAPPPVYAAPVYATPAAQTCYAGPYVCPLDQATPSGGGCSCPTNSNARAYGSAR